MDDQTGDFFNPPEVTDDTYAAFAAPPAAEDDNVGDVYYGSTPAAVDDSAAFFNPPAVIEDISTDPAPIILGAPAPIDDQPAPTAAGVENVEDDDEEEDVSPAAAGTGFSSSEPTPMQKWNDEWQQTLLARKDEENAKKASDVETARAEIEAFQAEREKRREARMVKNRSEEQDKLEAIEADLENDNSWQKVVKMIELNQDSSEGAENTGRMRDVLVLLKNEPQRAEGLTA
eukprot:CAMPEP_0201714024 /NCGR_PEP_ID=MMETSP0593-20130828/655_1 /ASSEMBLY_ACC=CAM_ASM_000672 /TAXON_ID=267983 /ORGANISM="Skeletonema japonicum, Strain CCMP2506" /LENGTH=230 /DNA_ID=CAMNT_0048203249 /DNA_START=71 /DNA_END=763 /DNA_ORIENTATION=+